MLQITDSEINLLESREINYKRGLLTFWILLLWLAVGALVIIAALYWSLRRRMDAREELFP